MTLPPSVQLFTFADDLLLVGTGKSLDLLQIRMQETLDSLDTICQRASMTVNPAKASACLFSLSKRALPPCQLRYAGRPIPSEDSVTHLGITLDKGLSFNIHVEKVVSSCTRSLGVLKMAKRKGVNQARLLQLYRSLVQSRLLYGAEVITATASALEKLDRLQTAALRIVTGCTRDTARATLRYMANLQSVPQQVETLRVKAVARALESHEHPLHEVARGLVTRPPLRRLRRAGWLRRASDTLRELRGRHQFRSRPQFEPTPDGVAELWTIISQHSLGRSSREWPPGVASVEFESLLEELMAEGDALLATDGSVIREPLPRSGWGCFIRSAELTQSVSGATRLVLSSMRAETEAVTVGLNALNQLLPDCQHIVVATDSQSLLRKLEGGVSPPEWWTDRRITWLYCPGHAGVEVNEKADRLAGNGAPATSRIVLSASDFQQLLKFKMETDDARKPNPGEAEVGRMARVGLRPGWIARSGLCGPRGRMACQLACGTVSRRTLADICTLGGAGTAWRRIFGSRSVDEAVAEE
ncbi:putative RNA-directed DNA polymerase from transposon BS [Amphibalanus amphitrite]|uniref:Putative RNA-directed DNA polymerase from transposon BS n=1 Tax=Amphibalanus amphitrite TaxID=1232801 RepID=A0A6A4V397_AMPAM|nr:putative RNA-directed DNA polymerase from transposon BS [Amphibalanus amphitrite]